MRRRLCRALLLAGVIPAISAAGASGQSLSSSGIGVWWTASGRSASLTSAASRMPASIQWTVRAPGVETAELPLRVLPGIIRLHVVLVRLTTGAFDTRIVHATDESHFRGTWTVDSSRTDDRVRVAVNAGQFLETGPWGWIVEGGTELAGPRRAPLAAAIGFDSTGHVRWFDDSDVAYHRTHPRESARIVTAFQSYPRLLEAGRIVDAVATGAGMDVSHRDTRLAIGTMDDGAIVLALTRLGRDESAASRIPIGLTTREMAGLMKAIGCRDAMMLDGGLSAQLFVRPDTAPPLLWRGARRVPIGLVFRTR
jgi:uncharacterized protein YigE (DUF2233 family)